MVKSSSKNLKRIWLVKKKEDKYERENGSQRRHDPFFPHLSYAGCVRNGCARQHILLKDHPEINKLERIWHFPGESLNFHYHQ